MLGNLREFAGHVKPKAVLWFFYEGNDLSDLEDEKQSPMLIKYLDPGFSQGLYYRQGEIDKSLRKFFDQALQGYRDLRNGTWWRVAATYGRDALLLRRLRHLVKTAGDTPLERPSDVALKHLDPDYELFQKIVAEAAALVQSWGGRIYFIYLPRSDFITTLRDHPDIRNHRRNVKKILKALNISFIDMVSSFQSHDNPMSLYARMPGGYGHFNISGYRLVGQSVVERLSQDGLKASRSDQ